MCGIVGYTGPKQATPFLINGLKRLEYRGYDSAGIACIDNSTITIHKAAGKVAELDGLDTESDATTGLGHTRWATHGVPNKVNAHPHQAGDIALVHNGIIENYEELKKKLSKKGIKFKSDTDSEVLAWLINSEYIASLPLEQAVLRALKQVVGTFGIGVVSQREPGTLVGARRGSPLLVGIGKKEHFIASDASALVGHTDKVIYLDDDQLVVCTPTTHSVVSLDNKARTVRIDTIDQDLATAEKEGFDHFLIKEIYEQPKTLANTLRGRLQKDGKVVLGGLNISDYHMRDLEHILIIACGTARFAGIMGQYMLEKMIGVPVSVEYGSEFRYREAALPSNKCLAVLISQSGETADTLASMEEVKHRGIFSLGLVNVVGSTLAREVDGGIYLHAGPEISVASTKAYSAMVVALMLLGLKIAEHKGVPKKELKEIAASLYDLPKQIEKTLKLDNDIKKIAKKLAGFKQGFYLGRGYLFPAALEGAIKLMEVSYMNIQPYPTGEMKHGPIALVDPSFLSIVLLPEDDVLYSKSMSNLEEIKARSGVIFSISSRPKPKLSDYHIQIPKVSHWIEPLVLNVVSQLFAYHVAVARGNNVDQPRNLAKSVTVE